MSVSSAGTDRQTDSEIHACVNCHTDEYEVPLTEWRMATQSFWLCPRCLPQFIHRLDEVLVKWRLDDTLTYKNRNAGESHA